MEPNSKRKIDRAWWETARFVQTGCATLKILRVKTRTDPLGIVSVRD